MSLVIFDLDGTLVDTAPAFAAAWQQAVSNGDSTVLSSKDMEAILADEPTYQAVFHRLAEVGAGSSGAVSENDVERLEEAFHERYPANGKLYPGVYRLLMALEDQASCGIVGSPSLSLLPEMVDYFGLDGYVTRAYSMGSEEAPVEEVVADWMEETASPPEETIWVSSRRHQLETARAAGLQTAFAAYGYGASPDWTPNHRVERLSQLFRLFSER